LGGNYENKISATILAVTYMFIPMISVILVEKVIHKEQLQHNLLISFKINRWFFFAWLITPIISFLTLGISLLLPGVNFSPEMTGMINRYKDILSAEQMEQIKISIETMPFHPIWMALLQGLIAGVTINAIAGFGEELAWRGFLLKSFKQMNFFQASVTIGLIWGIWHSPLILMGHNYPDHPVFGVLMMTIWCILLTPLFLYVTIKAKSVIAAAIMHGTLNGTAGIALIVIEGGNDLTIGMMGLAGFISLMIFISALFVYDSRISKEKIMTNRISNYL
jgi:membrane protease YdiL (CAAX protease family)